MSKISLGVTFSMVVVLLGTGTVCSWHFHQLAVVVPLLRARRQALPLTHKQLAAAQTMQWHHHHAPPQPQLPPPLYQQQQHAVGQQLGQPQPRLGEPTAAADPQRRSPKLRRAGALVIAPGAGG